MSINSISGSNSAAQYAMRTMQKPDPSKMAEDLFSKLDTKNQGYLEKTDLKSALSELSSTSNSDSSMSADDMFAKLDSNGDGKVTQQEMSATFKQIASKLDGPFPRMRMQKQGDMPPPPPPQKAMSYRQENSTTSTNPENADSNTLTTNTSDNQFMKQVMELMKAYGGFDLESKSSSFSSSV